MNKSNAPRFSELLDWLEGRLPPDKARDVAERLKTADAAMQTDLDWLRLFQQARQSVQFASPPPSIRQTLIQRFAEARQPPGPFQRWLATLTFDSRTQPVTAGLRSAVEESQRRQLIYITKAAEIALTIQSILPDKNFIVTGQIFPRGDTPTHTFSIQLLRDAEEVALSATDELGEFTFSDLPAGDYDIVVSTEQYEVVIPSLHLQL